MKNLLLNLSLLLATVVIFFGVIEIALRASGLVSLQPNPPNIYKTNPDPKISYDLIPSLSHYTYRSKITTDSHGFRSPEPDRSKPSIAILGDSIAFGYGVNDDQTLGARLNALLDDRFNVINAAVPGYNLLQESETYQKKVAPLKPQSLIVVFYWNDLKDLEPAVLASDGALRPKGEPATANQCQPITQGILQYLPGKCWLDLHSALYRGIRKFLSAKTEKQNQKAQEVQNKSTPYGESLKPENLDIYAKTLDDLMQSFPPNLPRLFVIWPDKELHFLLRPKIRKVAEDRGFKVLDLYDVFGNQAETLSWDTVHPSAKTLDQAAAIVKATLEHERLLPIQ